MNVINQKPVELTPVYNPIVSGVFQPDMYLEQTITQLYNSPINTASPVQFTSNGNNLSTGDITNIFLKCFGTTFDATAQTAAKEILKNTLVYFNNNTTLSIDEMFITQSLTKTKMPEPNSLTIYTPGADVIPSARQFLAGKVDWDTWFASLACYARVKSLGFSFSTENSFEDFKIWLSTQTTAMQSQFPANTNNLLVEFQKLTLKELTESLKLRDSDTDNNDPYSFARIIVAYLMMYTTQVSSTEFSVMPFSMSELYCPISIIFINVERHAKATAKQVDNEWNLIKQSIQTNIKMLTNSKINKLTSTARAIQKAQSMANSNMMNQMQAAKAKASITKFARKEPSAYSMAKIIKKVMDKMSDVARSENVYFTQKATFQKQNRRDPDDFNKMGKSFSTKYHPDIHIYLDTSGSISEDNYKASIQALIVMSKKLNVNIYFNSFSHILSQTSKLQTKDKSLQQIWLTFAKIPKVTGGTEYEQIWHFINRKRQRKQEISIIITDFEWSPPNHYVEHPKNLYYIPCANMSWKSICRYADNFVKSMEHIDPLIRNHLLF